MKHKDKREFTIGIVACFLFYVAYLVLYKNSSAQQNSEGN
jgi:hypothetical protein